jgi:hypothetical protein
MGGMAVTNDDNLAKRIIKVQNDADYLEKKQL